MTCSTLSSASPQCLHSPNSTFNETNYWDTDSYPSGSGTSVYTSDESPDLPVAQSFGAGDVELDQLLLFDNETVDDHSFVDKLEHYFAKEQKSAIIYSVSHPPPPSGEAKVGKTGSTRQVVVDPNDKRALRRARNTEAARRSRAKKNERIEQLEQMVAALQARNSELVDQNSRLVTENESLKVIF